MSDAYEELANGIILQAVKDYRQALRAPKGFVKAEVTIYDCEKFFRSQWFRTLTAIDGNVLIEDLRKEVNHGNREQDDS